MLLFRRLLYSHPHYQYFNKASTIHTQSFNVLQDYCICNSSQTRLMHVHPFKNTISFLITNQIHSANSTLWKSSSVKMHRLSLKRNKYLFLDHIFNSTSIPRWHTCSWIALCCEWVIFIKPRLLQAIRVKRCIIIVKLSSKLHV